MNLNEVKKQIYLQIAIYIGIGICLILSLIAILITPVSAATQLVSQDITNAVTTYNGVCSGGFKQYCVYHTNSTNAATFTIPNSELMGSNNVLSFAFNSNYGFSPNSPTTVTIEFTNNINNNSNYSCSIETVNGYTGTCNATRTANNKMNINFTSLGVNDNYQFFIANNGGINSSDYFGIKKIVVYQTVGSDNSDIINNANQNTTDIINNSNSNTQDIINSINNGLADLCTNRFNNFDIYQRSGVDNVNVTPNNIMLQSNSAWGHVVYRLSVELGKTYFFKGSFTSAMSNSILLSLSYNGNDIVNTRFWNYEPYSDNVGPIQTGSWSTSFVSDRNGYVYLGIWVNKGNSGNNASYFELTFNTDDKPFCVFGSTTSKLDEQLKAQQEANRILNELGFKTDETNAYLKDDTNPSVNQSGIDNVIGQVQIQDPLNYLLTLPLNLLTKLNSVISSGTCSRASFGELYGTELYLPCINFENYLGSSLWGTIDTIVGIGLLVVILKKFYDTISNILSLGKEEEIRKGMELPTPMEFLAQILGGGR